MNQIIKQLIKLLMPFIINHMVTILNYINHVYFKMHTEIGISMETSV